jgi:hypothetical protein
VEQVKVMDNQVIQLMVNQMNGQPGEGEAGEGEGNKELEVEMGIDELAKILG